MGIGFDQALGIHDDALRFRSQRAAVLANNLANQDTPNFKARDMDFQAAMAKANDSSQTIRLATTHSNHNQATGLIEGDSDELYRVPTQPSINGNTVEEHVEHGKHMENALQFQATFTFLNGKFKGLTSAIRGE